MTTLATGRIDSSSIGDSSRFLTLAQLKQGLAASADPPRDRGRVAFIMARGEGGLRKIGPRVELSCEDGVIGDAWGRKRDRDPDMQIAVMQAGVAVLIANGQPAALFGDCLHLELDLSASNLPAGSRLRVGTATLEVTAAPHNGCRKFLARFGADALQFVSAPETRNRNLRGIYMRVVARGHAQADDAVEVLTRSRR